MQEKVKKFNEDKICHKKQMPVCARLLDIQSELGELSKEYLKNSNYGTSKFVLTSEFKMEFGDVLYSILSLASELKLEAEKCLDMALLKYKSRIKEKNSMGSDRK